MFKKIYPKEVHIETGHLFYIILKKTWSLNILLNNFKNKIQNSNKFMK